MLPRDARLVIYQPESKHADRIDVHTWRRLGLMTAQVAMHGGAYAGFEVTSSACSVFDLHNPVRLSFFRTPRDESTPAQSMPLSRDTPPIIIELFKRFAVGCAALDPTCTFWIQTSSGLARGQRLDVGQFWGEHFQLASQWVAKTLPVVMLAPRGVPGARGSADLPPPPSLRESAGGGVLTGGRENGAGGESTPDARQGPR